MLAVSDMANGGVCSCTAIVSVVSGGKAIVKANGGSSVVVSASNVQMVGIDPSGATAVESDVLEGKTFYAGSSGLKVGTLDQNVLIMKAIDMAQIGYFGGYTMASDEEYASVQDYFQYWARIIMKGVEE